MKNLIEDWLKPIKRDFKILKTSIEPISEISYRVDLYCEDGGNEFVPQIKICESYHLSIIDEKVVNTTRRG